LGLRGGAVALSLLFGLASCSETPPPLPAASANAHYHLGAGDQVRILTYGDDHLSGTFSIGDNGSIDMPLLGAVAARGKTTDGLAEAIAGELKSRQLMQKASVSVEIVAYRPVFILGEVVRPGRYPFEPGMTVLTVVAIAGGFTYRAKKEQMIIARDAEGGTVQGVVPSTAPVEPADVITVQERYF
jgi:polysaccharide export outer membrane protein